MLSGQGNQLNPYAKPFNLYSQESSVNEDAHFISREETKASRLRADWLEGRNHKLKKRLESATDEKKKIKLLLKSEWDEEKKEWDEEKKGLDETVADLQALLAVSRESNRVLERDAENSNEEWIGSTLKLKFILDEIKKLGILPEDHAEWIQPMVEDIEIPDIPHRVRMRFLPCYEDAHMEFVSEQDEQELIERLSQEASEYSEMIGELGLIGEETINACVTIQKIFRGFVSRRILSFDVPPDINPIRFSSGCHFQRTYHMPHRASIRFINTGDDIAEFSWIRPSGPSGNSTPINMSSISRSGCGACISTFPGHWFRVSFKRPGDWRTTWKYIRIPLYFVRGWVYDVKTGITMTSEQWCSSSSSARIRWQNGLNTQIPEGQTSSGGDDGDEGFEERMALAIQMSMTIDDRSVVHMTDDIPHEYGLGMWEMFN